MFKLFSLNNLISYFTERPWFGKLCCMGRFPIYFKTKILFPDGENFNDAVGVEVLCWNGRGCTLIWAWVYILSVSHISVELLLCFMGLTTDYDSSSLLTSVSIWFVGIMFDTGEGWLREIIAAPQPSMLIFWDEDAKRVCTTTFVWCCLRHE